MQGRGGKGVLTIQYDRRRGKLVGALIVDLDTEVYAITSGGGVIRTLAKEVRKAKRQTMGVRLMNLSEGDSLVAIARNADAEPPVDDGDGAAAGDTVSPNGSADGAVVVTTPAGRPTGRWSRGFPARPPAPPAQDVADGRSAARRPRPPGRGTATAAGSENARRAKASRRPPRLASLQLKRVDPWTVLKISLIVTIVMFFVWMIAVGILYLTLGSMDVWSRINDTFSTLTVLARSGRRRHRPT